jgi:hypothetical protein
MPAICLLFVGILGLVSNAIQAAGAYSDPEAFEKQTREFFDNAAEKSKTPELRDKIPVTLVWLPRVRVLFACLSLVTISGAISMLRARNHGLALLGSMVAMLNITNCCCFGNILIGGWAVFTLLNPEVRSQFVRRQASGAA